MTNQIKTITLNTGNWVLIDTSELPKPGQYKYSNPPYKFRMWEEVLQAVPIDVEEFDPSPYEVHEYELPAGHTYTLIGKASELSEGEWRKIVEFEDEFYTFWKLYDMGDYQVSATAIDSGISLLKSQGMDIETIVILKQND